MHFLAAFLSGVAVDVLATLVFHYTSKNKGLAASTINTALQACWLFVFVDVSKEPIMAAPYLLGIFVGGLVGIWVKVRLERELQKRKK